MYATSLTERNVRLRRLRAFVALAVAALIVPLGGVTPASAEDEAATPVFEEQVIFERGQDGYACFRIPSIVRGEGETLLAFAEGRVATCDDDGDIDVVLKRSLDGGATWGPLQVIDPGNGGTSGNPVPVVDQESGRIVVVSTHNPPGPCRQGCDRDPFLQISEDNGATWTEPSELPEAKRPEWTWWYGTGPGHGIQLTRGPNAGRMVIGATGETRFDDGTHLSGQHLLISDDGGLTWEIGATTSRTDGRVVAGELTVAELADGRIYAQAREFGTDEGTRAAVTSSDGGASFDGGFEALPELIAPSVQGSVLRYSATDQGDDRDRLLYSSPAHPTAREVLTIRSSYDETQSWETWEQGKVLHWGPSGYSDLVRLDGDRAAIIYEAGASSPYETLRFAIFNEAFLDSPNGPPPGIPDPPEPGPTTPDGSRHDNVAYVRGGASTAAGRFGEGLQLDGVDDHVEVPFNDAVDLGADDFTVSTWIRYDDTSGSHVILWAYRMGSAVPQLWLRAEPASNRIRAHLHVGTGSVTVASTESYNDGDWHHVVLRRVQGQLRLQVDGVEVGAAVAPEGSVTSGQEFGVHGLYFGRRMDGADAFRGGMDELRVYRRGLTDRQLTLVREQNSRVGGPIALDLALDQGRASTS